MSCMIVTAFLFLESRVMSSRVGGLRVFYYIYTCKGCKRGSTGLRGEGFDLCEWVFSSRMFFFWLDLKSFPFLLDSGLCLA
jgi:hypothetical protein